MDSSPTLEVTAKPRVVGERYRVLDHIAQGGMASVYRAVDLRSGEIVALKLMTGTLPPKPRSDDSAPETLRDQDPELVARFQREAQLAGSLDTGHIVRVFDAGWDDAVNAPYLAMELLSGEDLESLIRRVGPLPQDTALRILMQACVGLSVAHAAGIVHRDIKPGNLFLSRGSDGQITVKLLDFGLAKPTPAARIPAPESSLTQPGAMLGSPLYMSPEQVLGVRVLDPRTDVWSLGVVLYKCLSGRTPNDPLDPVGQIMVNIVANNQAPVEELAPWVSPAVASVVRGAMQTKLEDRFSSVERLFGALLALLPEGWDLTEEHLHPLTDEERARVHEHGARASADGLEPAELAARAGLVRRFGAFPSEPAPSPPEPRPSPWPGAPAAARGPKPAPSVDPLAVTSKRPARAEASAARAGAGRYTPWALLGLAGLAAVAAWMGVRALGWSGAGPARSAGPAVPLDSPPADLAFAVAPPTTRAVVGLPPSVSSAQVDGRSAPVASGAVVIEGEIGSVHTLRFSAGGRDVTERIELTSAGARPDRVGVAAPSPAVGAAGGEVAPAAGAAGRAPFAGDSGVE